MCLLKRYTCSLINRKITVNEPYLWANLHLASSYNSNQRVVTINHIQIIQSKLMIVFFFLLNHFYDNSSEPSSVG